MTKFREIIVKSIDVQSGTYLNIADETKDITALDIYLVPKEDGEHERFVVDNNGLISKQSAVGGKLLPLSDEDAIYDQVSPYVSVNINKENGINFHQYDNYYGMWYQYSDFRMSRQGFYMSYDQLMDADRQQRSARFYITPQGWLELKAAKTDNNTYRYNYATITLNADTNSIKNEFYRGSTFQTKFLEFSIDGIKTDTLPNAQGDPAFTRQLVQREDGTVGYQDKSGGAIFKFISESNIGISTFFRSENPSYFTSGIGKEAIELVPHDSYNSPNNNQFGASGERSTAIGYGARAIGSQSIAIGGGKARSTESISIGRGESGFQSVCIQSIASVDNGSTNTMVGTMESTIGNQTRSSTILGGRSHLTTNQYTSNTLIAGGLRHTIDGALAATIIGGLGNVATSEFETILGCMATIGTDQGGNYWVSTDRLFTIGNGGENASFARSDAFQILKNGYTTFPSLTPALIKNGGAKTAITKEAVELVNSSTGLNTSAELNTAYPNAIKGFEVYFDGLEQLYKKVTNTTWALINVNSI